MRVGECEIVPGAWNRIEGATGQHFNHELWRQHRHLATTLPACRAVLTARLMDPKTEWAYMVGMFKAYFNEAMDPSQRETHLRVAEQEGLDRGEFSAMLESNEVEEALQKDLRTTRRFGITGFPSVVLTVGDTHYLISPGYQPIETMRRAINNVYERAGVDFTRPESGIYS